ncbi:hypothetical protein BH11MYX2_BH11MYX2_35580 [soil metagenome]
MLQSAVTNDVKDPRVRAATMVTVAKVELNVDLSVANVYVSIIPDGAMADGVIAGLKKAAGYLRGPIARELNLQHAPELRFMLDVSIDVGGKLAAIVREDEERAKAVGRVAGEAVARPIEDKVEETVEPKVEETVEPKVEENAEEKVEDKTP